MLIIVWGIEICITLYLRLSDIYLGSYFAF